MTIEQLNIANNIVKRISRLKEVYNELSPYANSIEDSPVRDTGYSITRCGSRDFQWTIDHDDSIFLVEAIKNRIDILEDDLEHL